PPRRRLKSFCRLLMPVDLDAFTRQLADLIGRFAHHGAKLGEAARELQGGGSPPDDTLVEGLAAARLEFVALRAETVLAAEPLGVLVPAVGERATSLEPVLTAMATALEAQRRRASLEEARDRVVAVLDRVASIGHQDDDNFGPLVSVKLRAAEMKTAALALTDAEQARSLSGSVQPFDDLLTMLDAPEALDDQRFSALEESVARAFGRQITVAVARRRLILPGQAPSAPKPEASRSKSESSTADAAASGSVRLADAMRVPEPVRTPEPEPAVMASAPSAETLEEVDAAPAPTYEPPPTHEPAAPPHPPPTHEPPPAYEPRPSRAREPVVAAAAPPPPQPVVSRAEASGTDETAQWWLAAWARWSGWKNTLGFPEATREELSKYSYLLSVPIQQSADFEEGVIAYGYALIREHVEKQSPGVVGNALDNLKTGQMKPVGTQLYEYLVAQGRLTETYPAFLTNVLKAAVPEPGPWVQARIIHSKDDTRVFQRPTVRIG